MNIKLPDIGTLLELKPFFDEASGGRLNVTQFQSTFLRLSKAPARTRRRWVGLDALGIGSGYSESGSIVVALTDTCARMLQDMGYTV